MPVHVFPSPNPNAMKFTVGGPVGGPVTHTPGSGPEEGFVADLLAVPGVQSIFMTADFVTITKTPDADWDTIVPEATSILEREFQGA